MSEYRQPVQIRWSDLDPNFHLRHSVYYDWGAFCRIEYFNAHQLSPDVMYRLHIGPILFREECIFRREIRLGDTIHIDLKITKARKDFSRWSIQHQVTKEGGETAAVLSVEGAWIHTLQRKLTTPPQEVWHVFEAMPKHDQFEWM